MKMNDKTTFRIFTGLVILIIAAAILAPVITSFDPYTTNMKEALMEPGGDHIFGTDKLGRDCFARILYGARVSLSMTMVIVFLMTAVGTAVGIVAGYFGGKVDMVLMRVSDLMLAFPGIVLAIAIAGIMGGSAINTILARCCCSNKRYHPYSDTLSSHSAEYHPHHHRYRCNGYRYHDYGDCRSVLPGIRCSAADTGVGPHAQRGSSGHPDSTLGYDLSRYGYSRSRFHFQYLG